MKGLLSAGTTPLPGHLHLKRGKDKDGRYYSPVAEWTRIAFLAALLIALWIAIFDDDPGRTPPLDLPPPVDVKTPVPAIDHDLLKIVKDDTRITRINVEPEPFLYLLETSLNVFPAVARALGMPSEPVPIALLRSAPGRYRGKYLWYRGVLEEAPHARSGTPLHPVSGYDIYEARLRTPLGEQVLCSFSLPPDPSLRAGSWVRMEGFFFKLRDMHLPVELTEAPMLIGPQLVPAFEDWQPVTELDPSLLATLSVGKLVKEVGSDGKEYRVLAEDGGESTVQIDRAQSPALWHLASYAIEKAKSRSYAEANAVERFMTQPQWSEFASGTAAKGTTYSIIGSLQWARTIEARPNPVGIEHWTEAWIQVRELGGRLLPIWIPGRIDGFNVGDWVLLVGHYLKLKRYTSVADAEHIAPLFVAAGPMRYRLPENPFANYYTVPLVALLLVLMGFAFWWVRRDNRLTDRAAERLTEMRRRRSGPAEAPVETP